MIDKDVLDEIDCFGTANSFVCTPEKYTKFLNIKPKSVKIMHINIRSVNCNFDSFRVFLCQIKIPCDVIILTECWLNLSTATPGLEGYVAYCTSKPRNQNDGVIVFVRLDLPHLVSEPLITDASGLVCNLKRHNISILAIYRSPSTRNYDNFISGLNGVLLELSFQKNIVIMGDINIDIISDNITQQASDYLNLLASHEILPSHTFPTRGNSCLDHVMVKSDLKTITLIFDTYITDHKPTFINMESVIMPPIPKLTHTVIDYSSVITEILSTDFGNIMLIQDANTAAELFITTISSIISQHTKVIRVTSKLRILKPWITKGLLRCIRNRDNMSRKMNKDPENYILKVTYKRYRNFCNKLLKNLKVEYQRTELLKSKNNPKATWKTIRNLTDTNRHNITQSELLNIMPDRITSINNANLFFASVGKNLAQKITPSPICNDYAINSSVPHNSLVLLPTDEAEVKEIILGLRSDAAVGWDKISSKLLKSCLPTLTPVITHICNVSLSTGCFPKTFKKAIVHPIFKSGDKHNIINYRPISVLSVMSKVLEKILNKRLVHFLETYNLLASNQYGFRRGKSAEDAVTSFINHTTTKLDGKMKCLGIFLDLSKAFDTVSFPHLLRKLEAIGVRGFAHKIFQDYLRDRSQCVKVNDIISDQQSLNYGVPQGSILGPTLFLIYVNDLCKLPLTNSAIFTYADDTAVLIHGNDWPDTLKHAEQALSKILSWLSNNHLTVNLNKSLYLPFSLQSKTLPSSNSLVLKAHITCISPLTCTCPELKYCTTTKYLGVQIDSLLNWKSHLESLASRVRKLIFVFKKLRCAVEYSTLKTVYYALCQSIISYCITAWGGASKTHILKLERAQRALLKVITFKPFRYPTKNLYDDCQVLSVRQLFILHTILRKHSCIQFNANLLKKRRLHVVCSTPKCRTSLAKRNFSIIGNHLYNLINKQCNIYALSRKQCKKVVSNWIQPKTYDETEQLIKLSVC